MPIVAFLHTHVLVVILFLILLIVKASLLFLDKRDTLAKVRSKTKVFDMILGTLILITGGYMLFQYGSGVPTWLIAKVVLVLLAIPLGIVGIKRENKVLAALSLVIFLYVYGVSETKSLAMQTGPAKTTIDESPETDATEIGDTTAYREAMSEEEILSSMNENALANARSIYVQVCATCHGEDGTKQLAGASDLSVSTINLNNRKNIITNGRGLMPAFGGQLSEQEVEAVAAYTLTLKK